MRERRLLVTQSEDSSLLDPPIPDGSNSIYHRFNLDRLRFYSLKSLKSNFDSIFQLLKHFEVLRCDSIRKIIQVPNLFVKSSQIFTPIEMASITKLCVIFLAVINVCFLVS